VSRVSELLEQLYPQSEATARFQARHYEALAKVLSQHAGKAGHSDIVNSLSDMFHGDNPNFKPERFKAAAGMGMASGRR